MNFLVTGGAGFIGSHVCERLLRDGHAVWILDDLNDSYDPKIKQANLRDLRALAGPLTFVPRDLNDRAGLDELFRGARFDQIIHLAARAGVRPSLLEPALYQRVNVEGTVNLLEAARLAGVKKVTIASSSSVYGVNSKVPFSESDPIFSAISPYAASKLACEALGHVYHHVYGMDIVMLRCVIACTGKEFGYEIFNLGESRTVTLSRLVELLETHLGRKAIIDRQPPQPGDVPVTFADISKARDRLAYDPKIRIEEGIPLFVEWFMNQSSARIPGLRRSNDHQEIL